MQNSNVLNIPAAVLITKTETCKIIQIYWLNTLSAILMTKNKIPRGEECNHIENTLGGFNGFGYRLRPCLFATVVRSIMDASSAGSTRTSLPRPDSTVTVAGRHPGSLGARYFARDCSWQLRRLHSYYYYDYKWEWVLVCEWESRGVEEKTVIDRFLGA